MNGVRVAVHQSRRRSERRKLDSMSASPSVAVVDEMAPRCSTASSLRPSSQCARSPGGTKSASCRLPRLRHLPSSPRLSLTAMSLRPASLRLATRLDPMNPAPPVTNNIDAVDRLPRLHADAALCRTLRRGATPRQAPLQTVSHNSPRNEMNINSYYHYES